MRRKRNSNKKLQGDRGMGRRLNENSVKNKKKLQINKMCENLKGDRVWEQREAEKEQRNLKNKKRDISHPQ